MVLLADIASTGIGGAEAAGVRIGDSVAVFAQGPIGLCASLGEHDVDAHPPGHGGMSMLSPRSNG